MGLEGHPVESNSVSLNKNIQSTNTIRVEQNIKQNNRLWDLFTKKEEYENTGDKHGRFSYKQSSHTDCLYPEVSQFLYDKNLIAEYPENKKFAVCLTHDVDDIYPTTPQYLMSSVNELRKLNPYKIRNPFILNSSKRRDYPLNNFKSIIELEEKYQAKSAFYFLSDKVDFKRPRYEIEEYENEVCYIIDQGWEVGLHGSYFFFNDVANIKQQKEKIERIIHKKISGFRYHYLRFKIPDTWVALSQAGFRYDTTFGYHDMIGFRNGMCYPFHPFDLNQDKFINIIEIPLIIMDEALFRLAHSFDKAWRFTKELIDITEKFNGVLTVNWHNNAFTLSYNEERKRLYEKILEYSYSKNALLTNPEKLLEVKYRWE